MTKAEILLRSWVVQPWKIEWGELVIMRMSNGIIRMKAVMPTVPDKFYWTQWCQPFRINFIERSDTNGSVLEEIVQDRVCLRNAIVTQFKMEVEVTYFKQITLNDIQTFLHYIYNRLADWHI